MFALKKMEWIGSLCGLLGSLLLAMHSPILSKWAYLFYMISGIFWIIYSLKTKMFGMLAQQLGFMAIAIVGIIHWF